MQPKKLNLKCFDYEMSESKVVNYQNSHNTLNTSIVWRQIYKSIQIQARNSNMKKFVVYAQKAAIYGTIELGNKELFCRPKIVP